MHVDPKARRTSVVEMRRLVLKKVVREKRVTLLESAMKSRRSGILATSLSWRVALDSVRLGAVSSAQESGE